MRASAILILSTVMTALYVYARPVILYDDSDPLTYLRKAWYFIGHDGGADAPLRGPGYPLWLIVTGAAPFDWWWGLVASHIAVAIVAPLMVYGIVAPVSRNGALIVAIVFMATGLPWIHMNWVMTEQVFLFAELGALLLISRYLAKRTAPFA